ncbi:hypothetical protein F5Y08DRAFT_301652 [Xylaria arbuscula]|nr:hypothetical protein F5Y08DRAFT_301652 [Xylaria arbuscula]
MSPRENEFSEREREPAPSANTSENPPSKPGRSARRAVKRSSNACERCRQQKIRCSGSRPCDACRKRNLTCTFNLEDQKIMVTRRYIEELQRGSAVSVERHREHVDPETPSPAALASRDGDETCHSGGDRLSTATTIGPAMTSMSQPSDGQNRASLLPAYLADDEQGEPYSPNSDSESQHLTNPLSTGRSAFSTARNGFTFYLGTSSNWSFTRQILAMTHNRLFQCPLPTEDLGFDCMIYDLDWDGSRMTLDKPASPILPSLDYCIYLINAVKFHCCQIFHLFDEEAFMPALYRFYDGPARQPHPSEELWYVHFLLILAFGKAFTTKKSQGTRPPGEPYFSKALHLLPNTVMLWTRPIEGTEILCCVALYLQCIDTRSVAYNYIGQAVRLAMSSGLHTDMGAERFGEELVERSRRAWWTAYILDREFTSLMGLPQSHQDHAVCPQLPRFVGSLQRTAALNIRIKLSRIMSRINDTVYGADGQTDRRFLQSMRAALSDIAGVIDELRHSFPVEREKPGQGLSRISAHLHLLYHQCIILATRPLLFSFLQVRLASAAECQTRMNVSPTVRTLILMCLDSSLQSITILRLLQAQGLLEVFLPFDLDSLFASTVNAMVAFVLDPHLNDNIPEWLQKAYSIFEEFINYGNRVALFRKAELAQLHELLNNLPSEEDPSPIRPHSGIAPDSINDGTMPIDDMHSNSVLAPSLLPPFSAATDAGGSDISFDNLMTSAEMTEVANSIDNLDAEWVSQTILNHTNIVPF